MLNIAIELCVICCTLFKISSGSDCGIVNATKGIIESPNYPYPTPPNFTCVWKFQQQEGQHWLFIQFSEFHLDEDDILIIKEPNITPDLNFTGIKGRFHVAVDPNASLTLKTGKTSQSSRLRFAFSTSECKIPINEDHDWMSSPIYRPRNFKFNCSWIVTPITPNKNLLLSFVNFELNNSILSVYNTLQTDISDPVAQFSGNDHPQDIFVKSTIMLIVFDVNMTSKSIATFKAEFSLVSIVCSITENITSSTIIGALGSVLEPINCVWILQSKNGTTFLVKIDELDLINLQDLLIINDGNSRYSPTLKIFNVGDRNHTGQFITSASNYLYIFFSSVPVISQPSFKLNISVQTFGGNFYDEGEFKLPVNATLDNDVIFTLIVQPNLQVEVSVDASNMQKSSQILFYDIQGNYQQLLAIFTNKTKFYPVFSMSNKLSVIVRHFSHSQMFKGKFHGIPKGCDAFDRNAIGSYELNANRTGNCTWLIKPNEIPEQSILALSFSTLKLLKNDIVAIYEGFSNAPDKLVQLFNSSAFGKPVLYLQASNGIRIDSYISESSNEVRLTTFYQLEEGYNRNIIIEPGTNVHLSSLGYPGHYPLNVNCSWNIQNPSNKSLFLQFADVDIYREHYISVYSINNSTKKLILITNGQNYPDDLILNNPKILVLWNSTSAYQARPARGFSIEIRLLDCGANLTLPSGELSTPNYPSPIKKKLECVWGVTIPLPKSDAVNIIEFKFEKSEGNKNTSNFEIHDGGSLKSMHLFPPEINQTALSRTNKLLVRYTNDGNDDNGYKLLYKSFNCQKAHQCRNGICMHSDWRCNGINDCGDFSDEENCDSLTRTPAVSMPWFATSIVLSLILGIVLTLAIPFGIRKLREIRERRREQNYGSFSVLPDDAEEE